MEYFVLTYRIALGLLLLFLITKFLGKTQISQITPFDFISSIVLGELYVHSVYEKERGVLHLVTALVIWGVIIYLFEYLAMKSLPLRKIFEGKPAIVVRDGQIDCQQLKANKINIDQLLNLLRQNNVFSIGDVKYAILELNGSLSVLKTASAAAPTRQDLRLPEEPVYLAKVFINDGVILTENLKQCGFDTPWLNQQLQTQGITDPRTVFYAEWQPKQGLSISLKS